MALGAEDLLVSISVNFPISVNQSTIQNFGTQIFRGGPEHDALKNCIDHQYDP